METLTELDEPVEAHSSHHISRRTLVKGGLVAGGALWATPVVQVLGTRVAAAASEGGGPSYVMLVLYNGTSYFVMKVSQDNPSHPSCTTDPNNGNGKGAGLQRTAFTDYLNDSAAHPSWTAADIAPSCPANPIGSAASGQGLQITLNAGIQLVGYMVHDGSLPGNGGTSSQTAVPGDPSLSGWTLPPAPPYPNPASSTPVTVSFVKP